MANEWPDELIRILKAVGGEEGVGVPILVDPRDFGSSNIILSIGFGDRDSMLNNNTATFVDYLTLNFTPKKSDSILLIFVTAYGGVTTASSSTTNNQQKLLRDTTQIGALRNLQSSTVAASATEHSTSVWVQKEASPGTSQVTYKLQFRRTGGNGTCALVAGEILIVELG